MKFAERLVKVFRQPDFSSMTNQELASYVKDHPAWVTADAMAELIRRLDEARQAGIETQASIQEEERTE